MSKNKKTQSMPQQAVLWGVVVALVVICGALVIALTSKTAATDTTKPSTHVSLGSMEYRFADGRAIKRTDASVNELRVFLEREAANSGCPGDKPGYEQVVASTKDETQVFLKYGCGAADSPMYAVKANGAWNALSPTNHFDTFGIPDCNYLAENDISREVAPVCSSGVQAGNPQYSVR